MPSIIKKKFNLKIQIIQTCIAFVIALALFPAAGVCGQDTLTVAVLNFDNNASLDSLVVRNLSARFQSTLVKSKVFTVVEREKMNDILKEQDFTLSDFCASDVCAVEVGQLIGVTHMVTGDVGKVGAAYSVNVRLIDVSTGRIVNSDNRTVQGGAEKLLESMDELARSLSGLKTTAGTATTAVVNIPLTLRRPGNVKITVYTLTGDKVLTLVNAAYEQGSFYVPWDGLDRAGKRVKRGIYVYTVESPDGKKTGKIKMND